MIESFFKTQCVTEVLEGLRDGLSHFSQPSRTALLIAEKDDDRLCVCDPQDLLRGHEPRLRELYIESDRWRRAPKTPQDVRRPEAKPAENDQLAGLISYWDRSESIYFQRWFTEHHPDICCVGPTERWLEYASNLLSRNLAAGDQMHLGTSGYVLQEYATHAVRDHIVDQRNIQMGWDTRLRVFPILDAVLGISKTLEEGAWARGELVFVEPSEMETVDFLARFPEKERPILKNFKHIRKLLLSVEYSDRKLISDGRSIFGLTSGPVPESSIGVYFKGGHGFLTLGENDLVCSFADGRFHSSTRKANLVQIEESLLEADLDSEVRDGLFRIVSEIVHGASEQGYGCTLVLDLNGDRLEISGQSLAEALDLTLDINLSLAKSLAKVDGALHIGSDLKLHAFACLLDGHALPHENRARGARFNSALRFSAEHPKILIVVVSSDRPVSVIQQGIELTAQCEWNPITNRTAPLVCLEDWLESD